ncbi:hypothetical protein BE221DRAFT_77433, partial [Ostreococcus tauri]
HADHTALPPGFIIKFERRRSKVNVIARTASYHEGENLCRALFGQLTVSAKLRKPHATEHGEPGAQHGARFGCCAGLGTRPAIVYAAPPGVKAPRTGQRRVLS